MSKPYRPLRLATCPLELLSPVWDEVSYRADADDIFDNVALEAIPTTHPDLTTDKYDFDSAAALHPSHAVHAAASYPTSSPGSGFVLARALEHGTVLELRWVNTHQAVAAQAGHSSSLTSSVSAPFAPSLDATQDALPPCRFLFPAPILPSVGIIADTLQASMYAVVLTTTGYLYRLRFELPNLFHSDVYPQDWSEEYRVASVAQVGEGSALLGGARTATAVNVVDAGLVLITCSDGSLVKLEQERAPSGSVGFQGSWQESVLRPTSFLSGVTRLFARSHSPSPGAAVDPGFSPAQALSIATHLRDDAPALAFAISRDRKLRVWNLVAGSCDITMDIPSQLHNRSSESEMILANGVRSDELDASGASPLSPNARPHVSVISGAGDDILLLVYVPAPLPSGNFFALYDVRLSPHSSSTISPKAVTLLWQYPCDADTRGSQAALLDLAARPSGGGSGWHLWSLWDIAGTSSIKSIAFDRSGIQSGSEALLTKGWSTVHSADKSSLLDSSIFDDTLSVEASRVDIPSHFLTRILRPGRFSYTSLRAALAAYQGPVRDSYPASSTLPLALRPDTFFETIEERIAAVVGCSVQLETDLATGRFLFDELQNAVRKEWIRFASILEGLEASSQWPLLFVAPALPVHPNVSPMPLVIMRDRIGALFCEDGPSMLVRVLKEVDNSGDSPVTFASQAANAEREIILGADAPLASYLSPICDTTVDERQCTYGAAATAASLLASLPAEAVQSFLDLTSTHNRQGLQESVEDTMLAVWAVSFDGNQIPQNAIELVTSRVSSLGSDFERALQSLAGLIVDGPLSGIEADSFGGASLTDTELGSALVADLAYQSLQARAHLAASNLLLLTALAHSEVFPAAANLIPRLSHLLIRAMRLFNATSAFRQVFQLSGNQQVITKEVDDMLDDDPEVVVRRMGKLRVDGLQNGIDNSNWQQRTVAKDAKDFARKRVAGLLHLCIQRGLLPTADLYGPKGTEVALRRQRFSAMQGLAEQGGIASVCALSSGLLGSLEPITQFTGLNDAQVLFAHRLIIHGLPSAALFIVEGFATRLVSHYLQARSRILLGELAVASKHFALAVPALEAVDWEGSAAREESDSDGLLSILPASIREADNLQVALALYYRHVSNYFESTSSHTHIVQWCRLALDAYALIEADVEGNTSLAATSSSHDLWFRLFRSQLALGDYLAAYGTVMALPAQLKSLRSDCLGNLVGVMCEAGEVDTLLQFSFPGLQSEIERNLSFKARNSDPRRSPNFYRILYAYHVFRGDLKSAGAVMYQQSHKLAEQQRVGFSRSASGRFGSADVLPAIPSLEDYKELAILQAHSYLAAINVLSLVDSRNAWFADAIIPGANKDEYEDKLARLDMNFDRKGAGADRSRKFKQRKLTSYIPAEHFSNEAEIQIVQIDDVRREYQLVLTRLQLVQLYPELAASAFALGPLDAVSLFARNDQYDTAIRTARALDVDMSSVFASLCTKCVGLSRARALRMAEIKTRLGQNASKAEVDAELLFDEEDGDDDAEAAFLLSSERSSAWEGPASERAWRYLRLHLEMQDGPETAWKYRQVVLERVLRLDGPKASDTTLPKWLKDWFENERPDVLIRACLRAGLIDSALQYAIRMVGQSALRRPKGNSGTTWTSYALLDELLLVAEDPETRPAAGSPSALATRNLATRLRQEIQAHIGRLTEAIKERRRHVEADEKNERRRRDREADDVNMSE